MNLRDIQRRVFETARSKGWHDVPLIGAVNGEPVPDVDRILSKLALIHSEVSEAVECVRDGTIIQTFRQDKHGNEKPEGLPSELADIVIRVLDTAEALGIDVQEAVLTKMEFNATRSHRHGGRLA